MANQFITPFRRALRWLSDQIVQDVSDAMARCEFHCNRPTCSQGEWETCRRRLQQANDLKDWRARHDQ